MFPCKITFSLVIISLHLTLINGQFGGFGVPFGGGFGASGAQAGFNNQNTNFNSHRGGSFGVIAGFGSGGQSTNFNQQNSNGGFSNFGLNRGGFREAEERAEEHMPAHHMNQFRYASPYDEPKYTAPPKAAVAPAPAVQCPQNLLIGCAPQVQYVPCQSPPPSY